MTNQALTALLTAERACAEATAWVGDRDWATAWAECPRADWMLWIAGKMADRPGWWTRQEVVLAACACAETALKVCQARRGPSTRGD